GSWTFAPAPNTVVKTTRYVFDSAGRQRFQIDGAGDVTEFRYDANGSVVQTIRHANTINLAALPASPKPSDVLLATVGGFNGGVGYATDFGNPAGLAGFTGGGAGISLANNRLVLNGQASGTSSLYRSTIYTFSQTPLVTFRGEITPTTSAASIYFGANAGNRGFWAHFIGGAINASYYNGSTIADSSVISSYTPGVTYVVEIQATGSSASIFVYVKGQPRPATAQVTQSGITWTGADLQISVTG